MTAVLSVAVSAGASSAAAHAGDDPSASHPSGSLRLRTAPPFEPPYDDELSASHPVPVEQLCFDEPPPRTFERELSFSPQPTSRRCLPDARQWATRFLLVTLEMLAGRRPLGQLGQWAALSAVGEVKSAALRTNGCGSARAGTPGSRVQVTSDRLCSVHVTEPADGVAEVCAVLRRGERYRALAARLEGLDGRWQCVAFRML